MSKPVTLGMLCATLVVLAAGALFLRDSLPPPAPTAVPVANLEERGLECGPPTVVHRSEAYVFECPGKCGGGDSDSCNLVIRRADTGAEVNTEEFFVEDQASSILLSPDKKHLLVVRPGSQLGVGGPFVSDRATVIDTMTAAHRDVYVSEEGTTLGVLTGLPAFYGRAEWMDNGRILLRIYSLEDNHTEDVSLTEEGWTRSREESKPIRTITVPI